MSKYELPFTGEEIEAKLNMVNELFNSKVDKEGISLGIASDGLIYIFVNGTPIGTGIPQGKSGDVFGYVDENNTVVLSGNLADGTYSIKYEMENGDIVDIGNMVLDSNVYYSITSNLTNCTNSNSTKTVVEGESYSATITANDGYELKSVSVTMGGQAVSVSGGNISIASVTGNIVITAVAEETTVEITNWIKEAGYITGKRLSLSSGSETTSGATDYECTGFIECKFGDTLCIENVDLTSENQTNMVFYDSEKTPYRGGATSGNYGLSLYHLFIEKGTQEGNKYSVTLTSGMANSIASGMSYIRIGSKYIGDDSVLNIKRDGVWL